jgi:thiol-disulfide isomerase/thioredoxin
MKKIMLGVLALATLSVASPDKLPAFQLPDLAGKVHASSELAGKPVLIDFWATWCATCKETVPQLVEIQSKYKSKGLDVVGISVDKGENEKVERGAKKLGITYQVLHDAEGTLAPTFGYNGIPSLYLFGKDGKLLIALQGYDPDQEKKLVEALDKL